MPGLILLIFAAAFLLIGPFMIWVGLGSRRQAAAFARYSAITLPQPPMGQQGYVEGVLHDNNPVAAHGLVAYRHYLYAGEQKRRVSDPTSVSGHRIERRPLWRELTPHRPELLLQVGPHTVRLRGDYHITYESSRLSNMDELRKDKTERFDGFRPGDSVTAVGEIVADKAGRLLLARDLTGQSFADFRQDYRSSGAFALIIGSVMLLLGIVLGAAGVATFL